MFHAYSETGSVHRDNQKENQDALCAGSDGRYAVIALADGVSSCAAAGEGARIAARAAAQLLLQKGDFFFTCALERIPDLLVSHVLLQLENAAREEYRSIEDYSSTLAAVLYDRLRRKLVVLNLGDGLILSAGEGRCGVLAAPSDSSRGCCVTTTRGAAGAMQVLEADAGFLEEVVILSDGAWRALCRRGRLDERASERIAAGDLEGLKAMLRRTEHPDDISFLSMELVRASAAAGAAGC